MTAAGTLVVVNPAASRLHDAATRDQLVARVVEALRGADGRGPDLVEARRAAAIAAAVREGIAAGIGRVVAVGGDGTAVAVAGALAGSDVPLGIVPAGTGNILAGTLRIPDRPERAVAAIVRGRTRTIDLGRASWTGSTEPAAGVATTSRLFAVACGVGFDARVMAATPAAWKRRLGRIAYFASGAAIGRGVRNVAYRIVLDGDVVETDAALVLVANAGELVPGVVRPRLALDPGDGLLDVVVVRGDDPVRGVRAIVEALLVRRFGIRPGAPAWRARAARVHVSAEPAEPIEIDGDAVGVGELTAEAIPAAVRVLVPAD